MPLSETIEGEEYRIGIWKISESAEELAKGLDEELTRTEPYSAFKNERRKREWLAVRQTLKNMEGADAKITYSGEKPQLEGSKKKISISHTKGYAAIAISKKEIGIDIEQKGERAYKTREAFMNEKEKERCDKQENKEDYAVMIWSGKEAVYKVLEKGCYDFKKYIETGAEKTEKRGKFAAKERCSGKDGELEIEYRNDEEYILTIATEKKNSRE